MKRARLNSLLLMLACCILPAVAQTPPARTEQREMQEVKQTKQPKTTQAQKEGDEAIDSIRTYSIERRKDAMERARQAAEELDQGAAELQDQLDRGWDRMSEATRVRSRDTMNDLRKRRHDLAEWYGGIQHGSEDAWTEVKDGFVRSYRELADAMRKARLQFARESAAPEDKPSAEKQQEQER